MNRRVFAAVPAMLIAAAVLVGFAPGAALAQVSWSGRVNLLAGQKFLSGDDWGELDDQPAFGIEVDFRHESWPISIAIDVVGSSESEDTLVPGTGRILTEEADTSELDVGVRKHWIRDPFFRPFVGGGIALVAVDAQRLGVEDDDSGVGFWLDAGIVFDLTARFTLGAEIRYSWAEVDLFGDDRQAGGVTAGALFGIRW